MSVKTRNPQPVQLKGVEDAYQVKRDTITGAQQLQRHHRFAVERRTVAEVKRYVIIEHIDRILHLALCVITTQHQEYHDGKCLYVSHN